MKSRAGVLVTTVLYFGASYYAVAARVPTQQRGGDAGDQADAGRGQQVTANDQPERPVTITAIPNVIAANAKWKFLYASGDNADGLVSSTDGSLLFAQWQGNRIGKIDKNDKVSVLLENTNNTGALAIDSHGRLLGAERSCFWVELPEEQCKVPSAIGVLAPERKVLADSVNGKSLRRINDLVVAKNGGVYFNGPAGLDYMSPTGVVTSIGSNDLRTNGIILSRDEKVLYVTNAMTIVAFDINPDGTVTNQRVFGKLDGGGGDGMTIDAEGRLYTCTPAGLQVHSPDGNFIGLIPTPRGCVSVAFAGSDKKSLYFVGAGGNGPDGRPLRAPAGTRNNARSIYRIQMIAQGFKGRAK